MPVPNIRENSEKCICRDCPTYSVCMRDAKEIFFCSVGKSGCEISEKECLCPGCPVDKEYNLTANLDLMEKMILKLNKYYCENGPAK